VGAGRGAVGHRHRRAVGWRGGLLRRRRRDHRHESHRSGLIAALALSAVDRARPDAPEHASLADHRHHLYAAGFVRLGGRGPRDLRGGRIPACERCAAPREGLWLPALAPVCGACASEPEIHPAGAIPDPDTGFHSERGQPRRARAGRGRAAAVLGQPAAGIGKPAGGRRAPLDACPAGGFRDGDGLLLSADVAGRLCMKPFGCLLYFVAFWNLAGAPPAPGWGGELRFCVRADPKTMDPLQSADQPGETVRYLTGGVLLRLNRATQALEPELAESWRAAAGGRSIAFRIRKGVRFSDGSAFPAADVVYTLQTLFDPAAHFPAADAFRRSPGAIVVEQRGPDQVRVVFPSAAAGVERLFDEVVMVSRRWPAGRRGAIGMPVLGPYRVVENHPGAYIRLARNPNYWRTDATGRRLPYIDSLRVL